MKSSRFVRIIITWRSVTLLGKFAMNLQGRSKTLLENGSLTFFVNYKKGVKNNVFYVSTL